MKSTKNNLSIQSLKFVSIFTLCFILYNCGSTNVDEEDKLQVNENYVVNENDYTFYANAEKYNDTSLKRGEDNLCQVETKISKVVREENILTIEILKPKNCQINYEIIWNGILELSLPMRGTIYVRAITDTNCNENAETESDTLVLKLEEAFKTLKKDMIENTNFIVRDACSLVDVYCVDNCNEVISY